MTRAAVVLVLAGVVLLGVAPNAAADVLTQLRLGQGCLSSASLAGERCGDAPGMFGPDSVAVSPDGRDVYVASRDADFLLELGSSSVASLRRNRSTGALRPTGCVSDDGGDGRRGSEGVCRDGDALRSANALVVTPDGRHVYATSDTGGISILARDARSGTLTPAGCVKEHAPDSPCADGYAMPRPVSIAVSPDGGSVYATSRGSHAVLWFVRDRRSGALRQAGCISDDGSAGQCVEGVALNTPTSVAISPDGRNVYVTGGYGQDSLVVLDRDPLTGALSRRECHLARPPRDSPCRRGRGLVDASGVAVAPDGRSVYTTGIESAAVATFVRSPGTGALRQLDCIANGGGYYEDSSELREGCRRGPPLDFAAAVTVDPAGGRVLAVAAGANALHVFGRNRRTGRLRLERCRQWQRPPSSPCGGARALFGPKGLAVSPRGDSAYVTADTGDALASFALRPR